MAIHIKVVDNSQVFIKAKDEATQDILDSIGNAAADHAKNEYVPYLTLRGKGYSKGALHDSIGYRVDRDAVRIYANTPYASYVESGTSRMGAQPYLKPAVMNYTDEYREMAISIYRDTGNVNKKFRIVKTE